VKRAFALLWLSACATLADGTPGLDNPPGAQAGPFRALASGELGQGRVAPQAISDTDSETFMRDPAVIDTDLDPSTLAVEGYFAASEMEADVEAPPTKIARTTALDGRSFDRTAEVVLEITHDWEGATLGAPSVVLGDDDERLLFYAAGGGIGLARASSAGAAFESADAPVFSRADVSWASRELTSPGAVRLFDGSYLLYFETAIDGAPAIGVAESEDGVSFSDTGAPVLWATGRDGDVDATYVGSPHAVTAVSSEGREIVYVYYTGRNELAKQSFAMAARFLGDEGQSLSRSGSSMYSPSGSLEPREPCVVRFDSFSFLFATQRTAKNTPDPVVVVAVSPGGLALPAPEPM
jgi:hypothetical protein